MKKILLILLLLVLFPVYANSVNDLIKKGNEFHSKFENLKALDEYKKAYSIEPQNFTVLLKLTTAYNDVGVEYYYNKKMKEAEEYMNKGLEFAQQLLKNYPDSADSYFCLSFSYGNIALFKGGKEKVKLAKLIEENAKKGLEINKNHYLPYLILGIYYHQLADLSWFERAFANTFFGGVPKGTFEDSERMIKKSMELKPNSIVASYYLAKTYQSMSNKSKEKEILQKSLSMKPDNFRDNYLLPRIKKRLTEL